MANAQTTETSWWSPVGFIVKKHLYWTEEANTILGRLRDMGIPQKILTQPISSNTMAKRNSKNKDEESKSKAIDLIHFLLVFIFWSIGLLISVFTFVGETLLCSTKLA